MSKSSTPARVVSVVSVPGGRGYVAPAIYEARPRLDGTMTWRRVEMPLGTFWFQGHTMFVGRRSPAKARLEAEGIAASTGIPFVAGIRHGKRVA